MRPNASPYTTPKQVQPFTVSHMALTRLARARLVAQPPLAVRRSAHLRGPSDPVCPSRIRRALGYRHIKEMDPDEDAVGIAIYPIGWRG